MKIENLIAVVHGKKSVGNKEVFAAFFNDKQASGETLSALEHDGDTSFCMEMEWPDYVEMLNRREEDEQINENMNNLRKETVLFLFDNFQITPSANDFVEASHAKFKTMFQISTTPLGLKIILKNDMASILEGTAIWLAYMGKVSQ